MGFNQKLRNLRKKNNMSVSELAEKVGLSDSSIRMYETGNRIPPADILIKLAKTFSVSSDYLLGIERPKDDFFIGGSSSKRSVSNGITRDMYKLVNNGVYDNFKKHTYLFYKSDEEINSTVKWAIKNLEQIYNALSELDISGLDYDVEELDKAFIEIIEKIEELKNNSWLFLNTLEAIEENEDNEGTEEYVDLSNVTIDIMKDLIKDYFVYNIDLSNKSEDEIRAIYAMVMQSSSYNRINNREKVFSKYSKD